MDKAVNKNTVACCSKRTAEVKQEPVWLDSALLLKLEEKLLKDGDGLFGFFCGEIDGNVVHAGLVLNDCDFSFFCDNEVCPVAGGDAVCGHAYNIRVCVRGGKVISYEVRGRGKYEVFVRVMPQGGLLRSTSYDLRSKKGE